MGQPRKTLIAGHIFLLECTSSIKATNRNSGSVCPSSRQRPRRDAAPASRWSPHTEFCRTSIQGLWTTKSCWMTCSPDAFVLRQYCRKNTFVAILPIRSVKFILLMHIVCIFLSKYLQISVKTFNFATDYYKFINFI